MRREITTRYSGRETCFSRELILGISSYGILVGILVVRYEYIRAHREKPVYLYQYTPRYIGYTFFYGHHFRRDLFYNNSFIKTEKNRPSDGR